jgi:hypothetical protein
MMNRFESLLKSNFSLAARAQLVRTLMKFIDTGSDAMSSVHKKARLGFAALARPSINQRAACRYDPPQQSAALFLLLSSSPLLLLRHYSPVSARVMDGLTYERECESACVCQSDPSNY